MIAAIEVGAPLLVEARNLIAAFHSMIRKKLADDLEPWIADAGKSLIASFVKGIIRSRPRRDHRTMLQRSNRGTDH